MAQDPSSPNPTAPPLPSEGRILCVDRLESLRDHLELLPAELRRCFLLRYHRGYGEAAIAVLMKLSADQVKTCLEQARKNLGFDGEVS